jgi:CarD family transcriptional regulator
MQLSTSRNRSFKVGDRAVYPSQGISEVVGIDERKIGDFCQKFYILEVVDSGRTIMVPVDKAASVKLRPIVSKAEAEEIYHILETKERVKHRNWNQRNTWFIEKIKTGKLENIAMVMRELCLSKQEKALPYAERQVFNTARNLLIQELAEAESRRPDEVESKLDEIYGEVGHA